MSPVDSKFGIYIHVPYCLQRCTYCDFATYEHTKILPPEDYFKLLAKEIDFYSQVVGPKNLDTIYFGGGTPSLVSAQLIVSVIEQLSKLGLKTGPSSEVTIEINPATLSLEKMKLYLEAGVNRFSVGAQTFNDRLLKSVNREHNSNQTRETLDFLAEQGANYSFDLLFALPNQTMNDLLFDLEQVRHYSPNHISAYCLTVPETHPLARVRLPENDQIQMLEVVSENLKSMGIERYEISNFAKPGFESRHNSLYWSDDDYLSFGLSAHSYIKGQGDWGTRFWNPSNINQYAAWVSGLSSGFAASVLERREKDNFEILTRNQSLTDFLHTHLRVMRGLGLKSVVDKFGDSVGRKVEAVFKDLKQEGLIIASSQGWALSEKGILLSNQVFSKLTFLESEI